MTEPQVGTKRKRSVIACRACHDRKVRCNIALQGAPCSNCIQDGNTCEIYRRKLGIPGQGFLRRDVPPSSEGHSYPLTPSPGPVKDRSNSGIADGGIIDRQIARTSSENTVVSDQARRPLQKTVDALRTGLGVRAKELEPYFAGESEGLEFLFDQCTPDRPVKGVHYVTPRKTYRHKRSTSRVRRPEPPLPPPQVRNELVRCFFHYVYPMMPIVNVAEFFEAYEHKVSSVSPLLLWSMFFAALNFVDKDFLRANRLAPRKLLKEQYYQHAKDIFDNQDENDKTVLIMSAILLAMWYVDLEDRDGSWYWIGTAISLAQTIGLHRASNYSSIPSCPFSVRQRNHWRRIWWCCFYREAWLASGFGRPMRVHIEDCDETISSADEVLAELNDLPASTRERYIPQGIANLVGSWLILVHLSIELADVLTMHYRPRSPLPAPDILRQQEGRILDLRDRIIPTSFATPAIVSIHICHLQMYFNAVLIVLYRPLLTFSASKITDPDYVSCREECISKAKAAASDTTNILNKLMSLHAIDLSPSMVVSAIMAVMQILVFDIRNSTGLGKSYAAHQLDLHQLVLLHLRKTYWTADLQHNLFVEVLKVLNGEPCDHTRSPATERADHDEGSQNQQDSTRSDLFEGEDGLVHASLDDFFCMFNPFMGLPSHGDELSASIDWELSPSNSLSMQNMSSRIEP